MVAAGSEQPLATHIEAEEIACYIARQNLVARDLIGALGCVNRCHTRQGQEYDEAGNDGTHGWYAAGRTEAMEMKIA